VFLKNLLEVQYDSTFQRLGIILFSLREKLHINVTMGVFDSALVKTGKESF
jgi:hypothetical protein